jgi:hypothetical protein
MVLTLRDAEDRRLPDVPEIVQNDGALILRKKRQRKLQNLGIGVSKTKEKGRHEQLQHGRSEVSAVGLVWFYIYIAHLPYHND